MEVLESPTNGPRTPPHEISNTTSRRRSLRKAVKKMNNNNSMVQSESEADGDTTTTNDMTTESLGTMIQWEELERSGQMYSPRFDHAVTRKRNKIYLFGGNTGRVYSKSQFLSDLYEYDLELHKWRLVRVKSTSPCPRAGHTMLAHRKRLHVFGGIGATGKLDDFWSFDPDLLVWGRRALNGDITPPARSHHSAILENEHLIVFGGSSYEGNGVVWSLDMLSKTWSLICAGDGIFGGRKMPLSKAIQPEQLEALKRRALPSSDYPRARAMHTGVIFAEQLFVFGGVMIDPFATSEEITNELWCFDMSTKVWTNLTPNDSTNWPRARAGHAAITIGHRKWLIYGGRTSTSDDPSAFHSVQNQIPLSDIWAFDFITKQFELLSNRPNNSPFSPDNEQNEKATDIESTTSSMVYCQPSRWGHDLLVCKKKTGGISIVLTGGVSLAPLPLY